MKISRREFLCMAGAFTASACIASPVVGMEAAVRVPVLLYHAISDFMREGDDYTVSPSLFAVQMEWLYNNGFHVIPLRDIANPPVEKRVAVITFDDGHASFIDYAFPLLREYGFHATINVIGEFVGNNKHGGGQPMLSWDEYRYLLGSGFVDIGCHSHALHNLEHKGALGVSGEELRQDLRTFRETMFAQTGARTDILAWPFGFHDENTTDIAREEGFRYIQTTRNNFFRTPGNLLEIPRKNINDKYDIAVFRTEVKL